MFPWKLTFHSPRVPLCRDAFYCRRCHDKFDHRDFFRFLFEWNRWPIGPRICSHLLVWVCRIHFAGYLKTDLHIFLHWQRFWGPQGTLRFSRVPRRWSNHHSMSSFPFHGEWTWHSWPSSSFNPWLRPPNTSALSIHPRVPSRSSSFPLALSRHLAAALPRVGSPPRSQSSCSLCFHLFGSVEYYLNREPYLVCLRLPRSICSYFRLPCLPIYDLKDLYVHQLRGTPRSGSFRVPSDVSNFPMSWPVSRPESAH